MQANLARLAGTPGGLLLDDAPGILREELPESGGYARILAAIGRGRHRYGAIASEAGQRIEHALEVMVAAGFVRRAVPVGAPAGAKPLYDIADPYLSFWFETFYADVAQIEAGQGKQVLDRARPRWARHVGAVFEERSLASTPAVRHLGVPSPPISSSVAGGRPPASRRRSICSACVAPGPSWLAKHAGRRGRSTCETSTGCRCAPCGRPKPAADLIYAFWSRSGAELEVVRAGARAYDVGEMIDGG